MKFFVSRRRDEMKGLFALIGVVFILLGIAALIHPRLKLPARERELDIGNQKVRLETQRIIEIPQILSGLVIVSGCALIFLGSRKP
jgi:hypothetical protein